MTRHEVIVAPPLVYGGVPIRDRGEMLSLTDMWKAAGADPAKAPAQWQRLPQAAEFIEHVGLIVGKSHNNLIETRKRAGTFAHWQIGLAYAKYLSPEFHMWCNEVVRAHMEGAPRPAVLAGAVTDLSADVRRALGGIVKGVVHRELSEILPALVRAELADGRFLIRSGRTAKQVWDDYGLPARVRGSTQWLGNRLAELGALHAGGLRADRGDSAIRLFDPDKARALLDLGLAERARAYVAERRGQLRLKLV